MRVAVRVTPRARRPGVRTDGAGGLLVGVGEPAIDGRATEAALRAIASALGLRLRQVSLVSGVTSRVKVVEIDVDEEVGRAIIESLPRPAVPPG